MFSLRGLTVPDRAGQRQTDLIKNKGRRGKKKTKQNKGDGLTRETGDGEGVGASINPL